jgi:hypothetical protein
MTYSISIADPKGKERERRESRIRIDVRNNS